MTLKQIIKEQTPAPAFWIRCERPAQGLHPAEVWYAPTSWDRAAAEADCKACTQMWPEINYSVVDRVPEGANKK